MTHLIFIDDDETELKALETIVGGDYECTLVHWPREAAKLHADRPPDLVVSDYFLIAFTLRQRPLKCGLLALESHCWPNIAISPVIPQLV